MFYISKNPEFRNRDLHIVKLCCFELCVRQYYLPYTTVVVLHSLDPLSETWEPYRRLEGVQTRNFTSKFRSFQVQVLGSNFVLPKCRPCKRENFQHRSFELPS